MANVISKAGTTLFPPVLVNEMIDLVKGKSALAKLSQQVAIPFRGRQEFTFSLDKEMDIVAENDAKSNGGATVSAVTILPIKFEYGVRVSDEFLYASEEAQLEILRTFLDGCAKKAARALDIAALHGLNPRTGTASAVVGTNNFDSQVTNLVTYDSSHPDDNLDAAAAFVTGAGFDITGLAASPTFAAAMGALAGSNGALYPEFKFGRAPESFYGYGCDVNSTVEFASGDDRALIGDFSAFRWGYGRDIELQVIEYGNPDNDAVAGDLKGHNQVYLRTEVYIGWAILDPDAFSIVKA